MEVSYWKWIERLVPSITLVMNSNSLALRLGSKVTISISLVPVRERAKSAGGQVVGDGWKRSEACEEEKEG